LEEEESGTPPKLSKDFIPTVTTTLVVGEEGSEVSTNFRAVDIEENKRKRLRSKIVPLNHVVEDEYEEMPWPEVQELKKIFEDQFEGDGMNDMSSFGNFTVDQIQGVIREGKWLRVKNGITMDSGSSVMVMPKDWLGMFPLRESEGSRRGQTYVAAAKDGAPILNEGERIVKFYTKPSMTAEKRKITIQVAKVHKILASVAEFCDNDCEVIFRKQGGIIRNISTGEVTPFRRHGNIYAMDAYIPNPDYKHDNADMDVHQNDIEKQPGFSRPDAR
jgi:hypothetical protein